MKETSPSFQFYPEDFEGDENVILMSNAEVGLYWKLVCRCWRQQSIPDDLSAVALMTRTTSREAERIWPRVRSCFTASAEEPGRLRHLRLDHERRKQAEFRAKQAHSGAKGALKRWHGDPNGDPILPGMATPMGSDSPPSPSPSPSPNSVLAKARTANGHGKPDMIPDLPDGFRRSWPPLDEDLEPMRDLARFFLVQYANCKTPESQERNMKPYLDVLAAMRSRGVTTIEAWQAFALAWIANDGKPLFGDHAKTALNYIAGRTPRVVSSA